MLLIQQKNSEQKSYINNIQHTLKNLKNLRFFYLFLIIFTFSFPLLKKLNPANTAKESQTIKNAISIVKIEDSTQNQIDQAIFHRNVANCSAQEINQILSLCVCSVIIADTTGFMTDKPKAIQKDTIKIIGKDKLNQSNTNNHAKNTKITAMNNFLFFHSSTQETKRLKIYGNLIIANTNAICQRDKPCSKATKGINNKLK